MSNNCPSNCQSALSEYQYLEKVSEIIIESKARFIAVFNSDYIPKTSPFVI
jgi:hypothetical protein